MERIKTLETRNLCESAQNGGCGECQNLANLLAKQAVVLLTNLVKTQKNK